MSRTPIREALLKLANLGMVEIRPQAGTFVSRIRMKEVLEANFIRRELEGACVREAAKLITNSQRNELMFLIDQQKLDHSTQNPKVFSRLDIEFHSAIHTIAGNSMCRNIIRDVRMFVDRIRNLSLNRPMELLQIIADHFAIATALQKADPAGAERAMNSHMDRVHRVAKILSPSTRKISRSPMYNVNFQFWHVWSSLDVLYQGALLKIMLTIEAAAIGLIASLLWVYDLMSRFKQAAAVGQALLAGQVDAIVLSSRWAGEFIKLNPAANLEVKFTVRQSPCCISIHKGEIYILKWMNQFVAFMNIIGELDQISRRWIGANLTNLSVL